MSGGRNAGFGDHFSAQAPDYARYRPGYPESLFRFLAEVAPGRDTAWDCGTGSGQAALPLAAYFDQVIATDASERQLAQAPAHPRVRYRAAPAEGSGLAGHSVDLVTVAQALHWFDRDRFYAEARRVLRAGGVVAAWSYLLAQVDAPIDRELAAFHADLLGPFWPPERVHVDRGYADLEFPFEPLAAPALEMAERWDLERYLGYLGTWSAVRRYREARGEDPVAQHLAPRVGTLWGEPKRHRTVRWPLRLLVGRA
ncbi:MAG TPA: class I SAM-dependent methyltransferase [Gammaproteobacteria bacterium]|nr:class I SAM-dependent methyltransferase [Gammaproteobacteria bacterium]